ncbi:MAG: hypothetical protein AAF738_05130 [Bacteroidota bacterium]
MKHAFQPLIAFIACFLTGGGVLSGQNVLLFVSHEETYYTEYIVMKEALEVAGYNVDIRSASSMDFSMYMLGNTTVNGTANSLSTSNYSEFQAQFQSLFGSAWDATHNVMPSLATPNGRIQDVVNMSDYDALIIAGGVGATDYRLDGSYATQGTGTRQLSASTVQAVAEKLNDLAIDALLKGKPILAQCHGASLAAFWRIPDTSGPGEEALGYSILKGREATGFPNIFTGPTFSDLDIIYRADDRLVVSSPYFSLNDFNSGDSKILTTRDWYPQTIAYAARTLLNIMTTYPTAHQRVLPLRTLILHGGAVQVGNCAPSNLANDIPCNYGSGSDLPADYTDLQALLLANSLNDNFNIQVTELDITGGGLPYNPSNEANILAYLKRFDTVIFYKHWSTGITDELLNALLTYADDGGGVVGLHHALYNHSSGGQDKSILTPLFGLESAQAGWSGNLTNYRMITTDYGHFISTHGLHLLLAPMPEPGYWNPGAANFASINSNYVSYPSFQIYDEYYGNMRLLPAQSVGRDVGDLQLLYSNNIGISGIEHTSGCIRRHNPSGDATIGRAVYLQPGERKENYDLTHQSGIHFGQVVRNAVVWAGTNRISAKQIVIKVMLQGAYNGIDMNASIENLVPLSDPYGQGVMVSSLPKDVVDWVLVELRDTNNTSNILTSRPAFLRKDGQLVDLDGANYLTFPNVIANNAHIAVKHRNHLGVMTALSVAL